MTLWPADAAHIEHCLLTGRPVSATVLGKVWRALQEALTENQQLRARLAALQGEPND